MNVHDFFEKEKHRRKGQFRNKVIERTAKATKLSVSTIKSVTNEYIENHGQFHTPQQYNQSRVIINPDDSDINAIRRTIHNFYIKKEYPTLNKILKEVHDKQLFKGGRSTHLQSC